MPLLYLGLGWCLTDAAFDALLEEVGGRVRVCKSCQVWQCLFQAAGVSTEDGRRAELVPSLSDFVLQAQQIHFCFADIEMSSHLKILPAACRDPWTGGGFKSTLQEVGRDPPSFARFT